MLLLMALELAKGKPSTIAAHPFARYQKVNLKQEETPQSRE